MRKYRERKCQYLWINQKCFKMIDIDLWLIYLHSSVTVFPFLPVLKVYVSTHDWRYHQSKLLKDITDLTPFVAFQHGYCGVALFFRMMLHSYLHISGQQSVDEEDSFAFFHPMWSFDCSQVTSVFWIVRARLEDLTNCSLLFKSRETTLYHVIFLAVSKGRSSTFIVNLCNNIHEKITQFWLVKTNAVFR